MRRLILITFLVSFVSTTLATDRLVPSVYPNIKAAIQAARPGDTVIVADGVYTGTGNTRIYFHYDNITLRSENGPENCIIDCNNNSRAFTFDRPPDANIVLDGFTITNGLADYGGAIYCRWGASPTIVNCIIKQNTATYFGGGIYCGDWGNPKIINCIITENTVLGSGGGGGGICCYRSWPTIVNSTITKNVATGSSAGIGGGLWCHWASSPTVINCAFEGNRAAVDGGGIYCSPESRITMINSTLAGNTADNDGGGLYCEGYPVEATITNCAVISNSAGNNGGGIFFLQGSANRLMNTIIWKNSDSGGTNESAQIYGGTPYVIFSCIQDDNPNDTNVPFGDANNHNIDDDPLFVRDPNDAGDGWGIGDNDDFGDLHLRKDSPCINAGLPSFTGPPETDADGQPRIIGARIDMGPHEYAPIVVVTKPQGGEVWTAHSKHEITWTAYDPCLVNILSSFNDGGDWQTIETNVPDTGSFTWHLPHEVDSNQCLISVVPSTPDDNAVCIHSGLFTIRPYARSHKVTREWQSLGGNFQRSGLSTHNGPETGCVKWQFETAGPVSASVTIARTHKNNGNGNGTDSDYRAHIACEDGKLYTLDANGQLLWTYDTNLPPLPGPSNALLSAPTIGRDGTVYVGSQNGTLYAIDSNGNLRWTHDTEGFIYSSPAVANNGNIYVCSQDGRLYALRRDGSKLWTFQTPGPSQMSGSVLASPTIAADGTVYIGGLYDPNLYALNPQDGSIKWTCHFDSNGWPFASPVVAENGTIYQTLLYDPNLYAIEPNNGTIIWSTNLADPSSGWFSPYYPYVRTDHRPQDPEDREYYVTAADGWSEPAIGPDGTIYVSFDDPYLRAIEPNGSIKWVARLDILGGFTLAVGSDGLVYAAGDAGFLHVVNQNGWEVARFQAKDWLSFPAIAPDHTIILSDTNNTVWAIAQQNCQGHEFALHWLEDLDADGNVNHNDLAILADEWMNCIDENWPCLYEGDETYLPGDIDRDGYLYTLDLAEMANRWLGTVKSPKPTRPPETETSPPQGPPPGWPEPQPPLPPDKGRCFTPDTVVWIDGALIEISKVTSANKVSMVNNTGLTMNLGVVEDLVEHEQEVHECYDIVLEDGSAITVVDSHYFLVEPGKWMSVKDLTTDIKLISPNGPVGISSIAKPDTLYVGKSYNLKIKDGDMYLVGKAGVIVRDY